MGDVTVDAPGFKRFRSLRNTIQVAQTVRVDPILDLGANTETIAVQAEAVAIRTESADVTTTVSNQMFVELPIQWSNGFYGNQAVRNPLPVAQILPGMSGGTSLLQLSGAARVPGQPLYLLDPNGKIDPTKQLILNPAAWTECGPIATFGCGAPRYSDFRQRRAPQEDIGLGRRFVLSGKEVARFFELRMEMYNPFNRIVFPNIAVGIRLPVPRTTRTACSPAGSGL